MWLAMIFFATGAKRQTPIANERVHRAGRSCWVRTLGAAAKKQF